MREELHDYIRRHENGISPSEVELFLANNKNMSNGLPDFVKKNLRRYVLDMCVNVYGKEPDSALIDTMVTNIYRKHQQYLSTNDVEYILNQVKLGNVPRPSKYFNPTDYYIMVNGYEGRKKIIHKCWHRITSQMNESAENKQKAQEYLREASRKYLAGETMTIYEKSAYGKHIATEYDPNIVSVIREKAMNTYEQKHKEVSKRRDLYYKDIGKMTDPEIERPKEYLEIDDMHYPIILTEELYFGILMFEEYHKNN